MSGRTKRQRAANGFELIQQLIGRCRQPCVLSAKLAMCANTINQCRLRFPLGNPCQAGMDVGKAGGDLMLGKGWGIFHCHSFD